MNKNNVEFKDLKIGQHLWVSSDGQLLMVAKFDEYRYQACGPWEAGVRKEDCKIVQLVDVPKGYENIKMYYDD